MEGGGGCLLVKTERRACARNALRIPRTRSGRDATAGEEGGCIRCCKKANSFWMPLTKKGQSVVQRHGAERAGRHLELEKLRRPGHCVVLLTLLFPLALPTPLRPLLRLSLPRRPLLLMQRRWRGGSRNLSTMSVVCRIWLKCPPPSPPIAPHPCLSHRLTRMGCLRVRRRAGGWSSRRWRAAAGGGSLTASRRSLARSGNFIVAA